MQESRQTIDFGTQLEGARPYLLKIAHLQLRNAAWAEDAVSETVLAALETKASFAGRSQLKTWLVGILKHKVVDHLRRNSREVVLADADDRESPAPGPDPEAALAQRQFLSALEAGVERLPGNLGRVFLMRECLELDTDEICRELGVTASNVWVMLHRARLRLRQWVQAT